MMHSRFYKTVELFLLFILIPVTLTLPAWPILKAVLGLMGFVYVVFYLLRIEKLKFRLASPLDWKRFWKRTFIKLLALAVLSVVYVFLFDKDNLFEIVLNKPKLWMVILLVYSLLSVYPQELVYRTFFFSRYKTLFSSKAQLVFINAIVFALAHLFFRNALVLVLTFLGGIIFALTFLKTKSTLLVSIEHAIYGCWLFTVGMGNMLGFPH